MPRAASSVGVERRVKRETALVSYNDLDATLTGNINDTPPSFEYDTPVSNCVREFTRLATPTLLAASPLQISVS